MKELSLILGTVLLQLTLAHAQVTKKIIVEHFTNTKCSVCASRNPGFHTNLNVNPA
jgi:hypothetical protein